MPPLQTNKLPIIVLGAGSWGTALALALARNGEQVRLWGYDSAQVAAMQRDRENRDFLPGFMFPDNIEVMNDFEMVFAGYPQEVVYTQDILIVVPSSAFTQTIESIKPYLQNNSRILCASKGLTDQCELLHSAFVRLIAKDFPLISFGIISGPSFAKEVAAELPTAVSCATTNESFTKDMQLRFHSQNFRVYRSKDIIGLELGGVIKNVLAIAVGISDGLNFGANAKSALITRGLAELKALCLRLGGELDTLMGLAGVGDLILSCTDNQSRNRRFGLALAQGLDPIAAEKAVGQTVEGKRGASMVVKLFAQHQVACPICEQVTLVIEQKILPKEAVLNLLCRPATAEY